MDESTLLSRTGKKLRKSLKAFRIHLKRVKTRTQAKSRINNHSSTLDDLTNLQHILESQHFRIRALNNYGLRLPELSLRRRLVVQLRRRPTIGVETWGWRMKRALGEVEQDLCRQAVAIEDIESALLAGLEGLVHNYRLLRGTVERDAKFQLSVGLVAVAERLQEAVECGAMDQELEEEVREYLGSIEPQLGDARAWVASIRFAVLGLAREASQLGVEVARQTLLDEYF